VHRVVVCCSVLQCVAVLGAVYCGAVCCNVLQCVAVCCSSWCSVLRCIAAHCNVFQCIAVTRCSELHTHPDIFVSAQCVVVYCGVLQCVTVYCSVLQCVAVHCSAVHTRLDIFVSAQRVVVYCGVLRCVAVSCIVWQCIAVCCSVLQCIAVCCSMLQCIAVYCSMLQCVAVCCKCSHIHRDVAVRQCKYVRVRSYLHIATRHTFVFSNRYTPPLKRSGGPWIRIIHQQLSLERGKRKNQKNTIAPDARQERQSIVLQCIAVCCSVLKCVAVCCICVCVHGRHMSYHLHVNHCVAVCCSVLQCSRSSISSPCNCPQ